MKFTNSSHLAHPAGDLARPPRPRGPVGLDMPTPCAIPYVPVASDPPDLPHCDASVRAIEKLVVCDGKTVGKALAGFVGPHWALATIDQVSVDVTILRTDGTTTLIGDPKPSFFDKLTWEQKLTQKQGSQLLWKFLYSCSGTPFRTAVVGRVNCRISEAGARKVGRGRRR